MSDGFNSMTGFQSSDPLSQGLQVRVEPIQAYTPADPVVIVEKKWYICTVANASLHRKDGTRVGFVSGFLETDVQATQSYLDGEIISGNPFIRLATRQEVQDAKMRINPRETIRQQVREELEAELRIKLEREIKEKLGIPIDYPDIPLGAVPEGTANTETSIDDEQRVQGSDGIAALKERMSRVKVPGATVIMRSEAPHLQGIGNSNSINAAAADSASPS
jgi:hypothetical protein